MNKANKHIIIIAIVTALAKMNSSCQAFVSYTLTTRSDRGAAVSSSSLSVGGKGWENNNYLDSLGGNDQDREKAQKEYQDFHTSRQAFLKRQEERSQTPEGQKFLQQREQQQQQKSFNDYSSDDDGEGDFFANLGDSSGGSRFRRLMQQAQRKDQQASKRTSFIDPATGLEMKFAVPLEEDSDEDE